MIKGMEDLRLYRWNKFIRAFKWMVGASIVVGLVVATVVQIYQDWP